MRLLLITGAGASRDLGLGEPLPLMSDWADRLCGALDSKEPGLAAAVGLARGISGPAFEEALGLFLRWRELRSLNERFTGLGGPQVGTPFTQVAKAHQHEARRIRAVLETLNTSLYSEFGSAKVDDGAATSAYGALLRRIGAQASLAAATTNYDPSLEIGLEGMSYRVETGFDRRPGRSPVLAPDGMVAWKDKHHGAIPVIHLHGAVGWYERGGDVIEHYADQPYNETLGTPVVLYPDPEKDPLRDSVVQSLWREFDAAIKGASRILVLGHSLHDPALVDHLQRAPNQSAVGICVRSDEAGQSVPKERAARVKKLVPGAHVIGATFGGEPRFEEAALDSWLTGVSMPRASDRTASTR